MGEVIPLFKEGWSQGHAPVSSCKDVSTVSVRIGSNSSNEYTFWLAMLN